MPVSFYWEFPQLDVIYNEGSYSNVVQAVHWVYYAKDGSYTCNAFGCATLNPPTGSFVNYNELTPEIVTGWVTSNIGSEGMAEMQAQLIAQIEAMSAPKGGAMPPPWQQPDAV